MAATSQKALVMERSSATTAWMLIPPMKKIRTNSKGVIWAPERRAMARTVRTRNQ